MHLTLRISLPHENRWLPPSFPALLLNSPPLSQVLASGSLFTREGFTDVLSFHTPVLILRSESSRRKLNLISSCAFSETQKKSSSYLKCLVLPNQNQLVFRL